MYYLIKNGKAYEMGEETGKQLLAFHSAYVAMRYEKSARYIIISRGSSSARTILLIGMKAAKV